MAGIHYLSIPTIDNCKLPNETIEKCFRAYTRYGKYKVYDILNDDLCDTRFSLEERERFKNINLIKRYLFLYRTAMAQTMSFAYNTEEYELNDMDIYDTENGTKCPKCGETMKVLPQRGTTTYYPYSYYDDIIEEFYKTVTFNNFPVNSTLSITFKEYSDVKSASSIVDYTFIKWSTNKDGSDCDMSAPLLANVDDDSKITMYACYASSAASAATGALISTKIVKTVKYVFDVTLKDFVDDITTVPTKNGYVFNKYALHGVDDITDDELTTPIAELRNDSNSINIINVFNGDKSTSDYILEYGASVRDLEKLISTDVKENRTFTGFTYNKYDKKMGDVVVKSISVDVPSASRVSTIIGKITEDEKPWGFLDRSKYVFDFWTTNSDGSEMTTIQSNTPIAGGTTLVVYAVFHDKFDEDYAITDMQEVYSSSWGENKVKLYSHYVYNLEEGTYCYDDRAYSCSTSDYIAVKETDLVATSEIETLESMVNKYLITTYGSTTGHPNHEFEEFYNWSIDSTGSTVLTETQLKETTFERGTGTALYAVYNHAHKHYGIGKLKRYGDDYTCPICGKNVSYIGRYSEGTHTYVRDSRLNILCYTTLNGTLGWQTSYNNGDNETTYGTIVDVSSISTLETENDATLITNGTICVDTSKYADTSNSSYKIYEYSNKRDPNYDASLVYKDPDTPVGAEASWIYLPPDEIVLDTLDTTGANKQNYTLSNYYKCYLLGNGDIVVKKIADNGEINKATLSVLAATYSLKSVVSVSVNHDDNNYRTTYTIDFSGANISSCTSYDGESDEFTAVFNTPLDFAKTASTYDGTIPNKVTTWFDSETISVNGVKHKIDGGYPTSDSVKNKLTINPNHVTTLADGSTVVSSYYDTSKFYLKPITEYGVEQETDTVVTTRKGAIQTSSGISATEGSSANAASILSGETFIDSDGNVVTDENYSGLNYAGWHWIAEDQTLHYEIDDSADGSTAYNTNAYAVKLSTLLTYDEDNISVGGVPFIFKAYSLDGYTAASSSTIDSTWVTAHGQMKYYKIYEIETPIYGIGIVEADVFGSDEDFISGGFKRVLFVSDYNSTGSLVRYCDNQSCYSKIRETLQRKWSYHNQDATVKNTSTLASYSNFSLDDYNFPNASYKTDENLWRYSDQSNQNIAVMKHRGGSGDIDKYRFDFEYKYATDEYSALKNALPSTVENSKYKSYVLKNFLKRIKGTSIVPMTDRPITEYQNIYKEKIYRRFNEIYGLAVEHTPFRLLNDDELNVMYGIIQGFPYDFRLNIIAFINMWNHFINYSTTEWKDDNYSTLIDRVTLALTCDFNSNIAKVGNTTYYKKQLILDNDVIPNFNTYYSIYSDSSSMYTAKKVTFKVDTDTFGTGLPSIPFSQVYSYYSNRYDPYERGSIDKNNYTFVRWSKQEDGSEITDTELAEFIPVDGREIEVYAYFVDNRLLKLQSLGVDDSWFEGYSAFMDKYYTDDEFLEMTEQVLTDSIGLSTEGVTKNWFNRTYNNSEYDNYTIYDYIDSITRDEFMEIVDDGINKFNVPVTYETGVNENLTLDQVITALRARGEDEDTEDGKFEYFSFDGYTPITSFIIADHRRKYQSYTTVELYKVYSLKTKIDSSNLSLDWFNGSSKTYESIKTYLATFHEKMALPITFMSYIICLMIWPKRFIVMSDSKGEVGSYFLSADFMLPTNSDSQVLMHRQSTAGNTIFNIDKAIISKKFPAAMDTATADSIYEQYYIIAEKNGSNFKVYSFMKNGWVDELFEGTEAYSYCALLKNSTSGVAMAYNPNNLVGMVPYSTETDYSDLMFIYDVCVSFFNCYTNKWTNLVTTTTMFGTNRLIVGYSYDETNGIVQLLSNHGEISSFELETGAYYSIPEGKIVGDTSNDHFVWFIPGETDSEEEVTVQSEESEEVTVTASKVSSEGEVTTDDSAILAVKVLNLEPYTLEDGEKPWIMKSSYSETPLLPREISDAYYNKLDDLDKDKYSINPKLTLRYVYENSTIPEVPETKSVDDSTYTFARFSFYTTGISIADYQLDARFTDSIGLYAIYYKDGVEILPDNGYRITVSNENTRSQVFTDDLNENEKNQGSFDNSVYGVVEDYTLPTSVDKIYNIRGFDYYEYTKSGKKVISNELINNSEYTYVGKHSYPIVAMVSGTRIKFCKFDNGTFKVISTVDYEDNNEVVGIINLKSGLKSYILYKDQKIVEITTYKFVPSVYKTGSTTGETVEVIGDTFNINQLFISYYTNKKKVHCVGLEYDTYLDNAYQGRQLIVPNYVETTGGELTTYLEAQVDQADFDFYSSRTIKWQKFVGEVDDMVQIN